MSFFQKRSHYYSQQSRNVAQVCLILIMYSSLHADSRFSEYWLNFTVKTLLVLQYKYDPFSDHSLCKLIKIVYFAKSCIKLSW